MSKPPVGTAAKKVKEADTSPRHRMIYVKIRTAEVRAELDRLVEERKALQAALKANKVAGAAKG